MRRRLLLVLLPLVTMLLAALEVPLAQTYADRLTQDLFIKRLNDAQTWAAETRPVLDTPNAKTAALNARIELHRDVKGIVIKVVDLERVTKLGARTVSPAAERALSRALIEQGPQPPRTAWPWRDETMTVAAPIGPPTQPIGAVVVESSTKVVRERVLRRIELLVAGGIGVLLLTAAICVLPLAGWILKPIEDLSRTARRLTGGELDARASERGGPPELQSLAIAFNRMADGLVAALERQRAFVSDASHELRNPLATLRLRLEALASRPANSDDDVRSAMAEAERLTRIVNRLLELARAEATAAERVDFDVAELAAERVEAWTPALGAVGSTLSLDAPEEAAASGSPEALTYALDVLLDNARKYAAGAPVDVAVEARAGIVEVRVRDHGDGLAGEEIAFLGERFWRSSRHRAIPGTGLGLATTRALVEDAGGRWEARAAEPGLAVVVRLPAATGLRGTSPPRPDAESAGTPRARPTR